MQGYVRKASIFVQMNRHEEALLEVSKAALANSSLKLPYTMELKQLLEELLPTIAVNVQHFSIGAIGFLDISFYVTFLSLQSSCTHG